MYKLTKENATVGLYVKDISGSMGCIVAISDQGDLTVEYPDKSRKLWGVWRLHRDGDTLKAELEHKRQLRIRMEERACSIGTKPRRR